MIFYHFVIWSWSKQEKSYFWRSANLACGDLTGTDESWNWGNYLLKTGLVCHLDSFEGGTSRWNSIYIFGGIVVGRFKWGKKGWPSKKQILINNPVIPFKEEHQGLLKLHVPLGRGREFQCRNIWCMVDWILS